MSSSYLFGINKKFQGKRLHEYENSWLFTPVVLQVLEDKYFELNEFGRKPSILCDIGMIHWKVMNNIMNNSEITNERVCWEMSNQQVFFTKDKAVISDSILHFIENHKQYALIEGENNQKVSVMQRPHIVERFMNIAMDIKNLDETKYPYFVLKNTSCDDGVEYWFEYDRKKRRRKTLKDWEELPNEFVTIENAEITGFTRITKDNITKLIKE